MNIKEISKNELDAFITNHPLRNHFQTSTYGTLMNKYSYETFYIGGFNDNTLVCACIILSKYIVPTIKYGYSPRGFIMDYYDKDLVKEFTSALKNYLFKRRFAFIKINPEITYSIINNKNGNKNYNEPNLVVMETLKENGYKKLKDNNQNFLLPKFNAIINTSSYDFDKLNVSFKKYISLADEYSLLFQKVNVESIKDIYNLLSDKHYGLSYYEDYYKLFNENNQVDALVVKIDVSEYVKKLQISYDKKLQENYEINSLFATNTSDNEIYNKKINSDILLTNLKNKIIKMSNLLNSKQEYIILAGAIISKYDNRISIIASGDNKDYPQVFSLNYLYYKIIETFKDKYKFFDLGGVSDNFTKKDDNLKFILQFNPIIYEYIGEYDLVTNNLLFQVLLNSNKIKQEFKKQDN